jgi:hypothetical protein
VRRARNEPEPDAEPHHLGLADGVRDPQPHGHADRVTRPDGVAEPNHVTDGHARTDRLADRTVR